MKQYISEDQIYDEFKYNIISFEQLEKLRQLLGLQSGVFYKTCNIGNMIEILENNKWLLKINQSLEGYWRVELDMLNGYSFYYPELCDALWQATKKVLQINN